MDSDLLYKEEVFKIIGAAIEINKVLGAGFLESVYEEALVIESKLRGIPHETQVELPVYYKGQKLKKRFSADYIGYEKIVVELKCIPKLTKIEEAQIINYLKGTRMKVGLLINFGSQGKLEWRRYANTNK